MQTKEDIEIQNNLGKAGHGLPKIDAIFLKHIGFPILKTFISWDNAMKFFEYEGKEILNLVKDLPKDKLFKKVLIPKIFGIEDNSRYYSPAMVLWHLLYVGETLQEGIVSLSKNEKIDFTVKIENFKPFVQIDEDIVEKYEKFLNNYKKFIERNIENKYINNCLSHPWFGCLNPHQWLVMSAIHQMVHKKQIKKILKAY
ncbi:hypothetical protein AVENP_1281 [Arcobacter venerupis]|uniref:DinB-like domain-containing protein n=1 Tax=Arcobacter venerupis TaxID=1054033 RepID=A0AAE7E3G8_9BACT|nr:hypothetical protein [Arcobacter venerupis]QKF66835.1 hypothetical protein AVENP_1281 [Arcobacter venerupis]RWS49830.1 hypothetical protein CKA56_07010 [Arcobacter venerupis]